MHPRFNIEKDYEVLIDGHPPQSSTGFGAASWIDGEAAKPTMLKPVKNVEDGTIVRITLHEGRNRIVRRMFEAVPILSGLKLRRVELAHYSWGRSRAEHGVT